MPGSTRASASAEVWPRHGDQYWHDRLPGDRLRGPGEATGLAHAPMIVGLSSALIGGTIGLIMGVGSAYFGGKTDLVLQRVFDVFMAFPLIIMALAVVAIFGTGVQNVIIAITIPLIPRCARVVRSSALAIREVPYVDAARALGFGH